MTTICCGRGKSLPLHFVVLWVLCYVVIWCILIEGWVIASLRNSATRNRMTCVPSSIRTGSVQSCKRSSSALVATTPVFPQIGDSATVARSVRSLQVSQRLRVTTIDSQARRGVSRQRRKPVVTGHPSWGRGQCACPVWDIEGHRVSHFAWGAGDWRRGITTYVDDIPLCGGGWRRRITTYDDAALVWGPMSQEMSLW